MEKTTEEKTAKANFEEEDNEDIVDEVEGTETQKKKKKKKKKKKCKNIVVFPLSLNLCAFVSGRIQIPDKRMRKLSKHEIYMKDLNRPT